MSDQHEHITDELGSYSVDDENQLQPEDTLEASSEEGGVDDVLDRGYSPADAPRSPHLWGTTPFEQQHEETIEQRIVQEVPDPDTAYGAPDNESGLDVDRVGGDDPDAIDADQDWLGGPEVGRKRAGRLVSPDEGTGEDEDSEAWGRDVGIDGAGASAEEAAMHIIDGDDEDDGDE